ncbi:methyltransferase [Streptomyces montanisoli]|uniref:Methyltransferase n=1 Tax=Streptomyces montanisoli TaxID=2798581 RepID=A0A940MCQ2_9ACTN|nr:methyltransferase [Streptomyces montanisoli]MBP0457580.1 methyltransferase [Streptomyces montanisoli]
MTETTPHQAMDETATGPAADIASLINLIGGGVTVQTLHAVAALRIPDHLAAGARTAAEVADREGSDERATYRLMRAAASLGVLSHEGAGRFGLTGRGRLLRTDEPGSLRSLLLVQAGHAHWKSLGLLPEAVRQGTSQTHDALGADIFDYLARPENADEARLFAAAMGELSEAVTQGAVAAVGTDGVTSVLDVGGADGHFVLALLAAAPGLRGGVLDLPHAVDGAAREAGRRGLTDRFSAVAGDFFTEVPAADLYLLKTVLHDWDDERCLTILGNCRSATRPGGRALVVETVVGEIGKPDFATMSDMAMLAVTGGVERDLSEFDALFTASGWRRGRTYPVGGGYSGLELEAV